MARGLRIGHARQYRVSGDQGAYALSGQAAALRRAYPLIADQGAYGIFGQDATLTAPAGVDPPISTVSVSSSSTRIFAKSTTGVTNAPFVVGASFPQGSIPSGSGIVLLGANSYHATVRNTWPDGSVKFALIGGRVTVSAGGTVSMAAEQGTASTGTAITESDFIASGITASISFAGNTVNLSSLLGVTAAGSATGAITGGRVRTLHSGHVFSSWLYCAPIGGNVHLTAWFEVRYFGGTTAHILPWIENGWTRVSGMAGQAGTLTFTLNGSTRFTQSSTFIAAHARVVCQDISGAGHWTTTTDLYAAQAADSLMRTPLVPSYFPDTSGATARLNGLTQAYSPTNYGQLTTSPRDSGGEGTFNGEFDTAMGGAGYHAGIGPLPEWDAFYLTSGDKRAYNSVIANAMGYGRYGVHRRDENTLRPFLPSDGINKTLSQTSLPLYSSGGASRNVNAISDIGANQFGASEILPAPAGYSMGDGTFLLAEYWVQTHHPSAGFTAYLLTGHEFFLELSQFVAGTCFLRQNNLWRNFGQGLQIGGISSGGLGETIRGAAWALRSIFQASTISVDGSTPQTAFTAVASANIAYYLANYITSPCGSFGAVRPYFNFQSGATPTRYTMNAWELDFSICAWGYGLAMKPPVGATALTNMNSFFQWHAQFVVGRLGSLGNSTTYGFNAAARQNSVAIANTSTDSPWINNQGPWMANWGEAFSLTHNASNSTNTTNTLGAFDSNNGFFPDATSYWANIQTALAYAVEHEVPGAWDGYLRMIGASNWAQFETSAATNPVGALRSLKSPPTWRASTSSDAFNTLTSTNYNTASTTLIPAVTPFYKGDDPRNIVDPYSDPAFDSVTGNFYLWGGGHGDSYYNGVLKFDPRTKTYSVVGQPTPPSKYLPDYDPTITTPIYYPSGVYFAGYPIGNNPTASPKIPPLGHVGGFFLTAAEGLNATTDAAYIAPALAKISAHAYAALAIRGRKIHFFCITSYGEFDIDAGTWSGWDVDIGVQLNALDASITNFPFSQGNAAVYDSVTDRFVVTLQPGDFFGMGTRNGVFVFNPVTRQVTSVHNQSGISISASSSMVKVGRKVYIFTKTGAYLAPQNMNQGAIFDLDTLTYTYFTIQGNPSGTIFVQTTDQETIPAWTTDDTSIHRWNYEAGQGGTIYTVNLTPVSGSGTSGSPYVLVQTSRTVSSPPSNVKYRYRGNYWPAGRSMIFLPKSNQDWCALVTPTLGSDYSTTFSTDETPISEGGVWKKLTPEGGAADHSGWHGIVSSGGSARPRYNAGPTMGGPGSGDYDDCYAYLAGTWQPNLRAEATIYRGAGNKEVELLFRVTDQASPPRVWAYECLFDLGAGSCEIARWNGPPDDYSTLASFSPGTYADGDRVAAEISGQTITTWVSRAATPTTWVPIGSHTDNASNRLTTGAPGLGFFVRQSLSLDYGVKDYSVRGI